MLNPGSLPGMRRPRPAVGGFSLIELMIGVAVLGIVMMIGLPSLGAWIQNTQIRNATESIYAGLQLARAEALKRNANVRFQLVTNVTAACALSTSGTSWVVSLADPTGACNVAPSDTTSPQIIQKQSGTESTPNIAVAATTASSATFTGLGRVSGAGITQIDVSNPVGGSCVAASGNMRCLRIQVSTGGQLRMCDPAVTATADARYC